MIMIIELKIINIKVRLKEKIIDNWVKLRLEKS